MELPFLQPHSRHQPQCSLPPGLTQPRLHSIPGESGSVPFQVKLLTEAGAESRAAVADNEDLSNDPSFVFLQLFHTPAPPPLPSLLLAPDEVRGQY